MPSECHPPDQPRRLAMPSQQALTVAMPAAPVKALALPALTRMARAVPCGPESLAAPGHRRGRRVGTGEDPGCCRAVGKRISSMSSRPRYFISEAAVARVTPAISATGGNASGASGETVIADLSPRIAPRQPPRHSCGFRRRRPREAIQRRGRSSAATGWR